MNLLEFKNVWEMYKIKFKIDGDISWDNYWALKDISFKVERGETIGIVGENGAGKSTVLKLIMGMLKPDRGEVQAYGRASGLLELGAGFQPELTGKENVYLNAKLFGLSKKDIDRKYDSIVDFASIGKFINAQVKCYSQGMFVRLAFAIAIHIEPEMLLIDDTLAVGDEFFQRKCVKKIFELKEKGMTIIVVTHDMNMLRRLCKRSIFLRGGRVIKDGPTEEVIPLYSQMVEANKPEVFSWQEKITYDLGRLRLTFDNNRVILSCDGINLTRTNHICSSIHVNGVWCNSLFGHWDVKKENDDKIIARIYWHQLPLVEIWEIEKTKEDSLLWTVSMEIKEELDIQEQCLTFECSNYYKYYYSDYGSGDFLADFLTFEVDMVQRCISDGMVGLRSQDDEVPAIYLKVSKDLGNFAKIFNSDSRVRARMLRMNRVESEENIRFKPGTYQRFKTEVIIGQDRKTPAKLSRDLLQKGKLRFVFEDGRGCIFWNGREVTKHLGLYTSLRSGYRWYDSKSKAGWKITDRSGDSFNITGEWFDLPIIQNWHIRLKEENMIEFSINMSTKDKVEVDRLQANIMLSERYKEWFSDSSKGVFSDFKGNIDDDWEILCSEAIDRDSGKSYVGVSKNKVNGAVMPAVKFIALQEKPGYCMNVLNSDLYHRGRILQYLEKGKMVLKPGCYPYCKGRIFFKEI